MTTIPYNRIDTKKYAPDLTDWCILHTFRGSVAHGMWRDPEESENSIDDIDTIAIVVPPVDYYFGLKEYGSRGTREIKDGPLDTVVYEARKMMYLLSQGNPNVLSMLWTKEKYWISVSSAGRVLVNNRDAFLHKQVYDAFAGYAAGQIAKMEKSTFEGYMGARRKALVEKYGYDTKNAAHCVRLLRMFIELMEHGTLLVERPDADDLLNIKSGKYTLEYVKQYTDFLFSEAKLARDRSDLPDHPDKERINSICRDVVRINLMSDREVTWIKHGVK